MKKIVVYLIIALLAFTMTLPSLGVLAVNNPINENDFIPKEKESTEKIKRTQERVIEQAVPENIRIANSESMTTKDGVPNAVAPTEKTKADPNKINEVDVSDWGKLEAAMRNEKINLIHIQADFMNPTISKHVDTNIPMRAIQINGNGHVIDFQGKSFYNNSTLAQNTKIKWEINHLTMYGRNYYGPIKTDSSATNTGAYGAMVYKNVTYIGGQLTASYKWTIDFSKHIENHSVNNYVSPFTKSSYETDVRQVNIEAKDVVFREKSNYVGSTENAGVFRLENSGEMVLEDYAEVSFDSNGNGGEHQWNVLYLQGLIKTGKEAKLNLYTRDYGNQRAIEIAGAGNGIIADKGSEINIYSNGPSGVYDLITMGADTIINIEDGATLNIVSKNKSSGTGDLIKAGSRTSFIIGKKAIFNTSSDGTGDHNILDFGTNSVFQFADAEKVNLQFTNNALSQAARLITMTGSSGQLDVDVQDVRAWDKRNIHENTEDEADYHWTPMFGMVTKFSTGTSTVQDASSVMNLMREKYKEEFKVHAFSRLLYSYIEDVNVGILNPVTDNVESENSKVIKGVANPGAYVRLTGDKALPPSEISSIIDGADEEELTANYTVMADEKGEFTVYAKEGENFTANNSIKAFAFLGGKSDEMSVNVLDETAPTAEGIGLIMVAGQALPKPSKFIVNPQDSNPSNKGFKYEFKENYSDIAQLEGKHMISIIVSDDAGNKTEIPVKLEVTKEGYVINADDFNIKLSKLRAYDTTKKLQEFLLQESKANAFGIINNEKEDLTEHIIIEELDEITDMKKGIYRIKVSFDLTATNPDAKAEKRFKVTVLNDEAVKPTNPEKPGKEEPEEVENEGTGQAGLLKLDYAPSNFNFGKVAFGYNLVRTHAKKNDSSKQWLQVSDERLREDQTDWSIQVSQNQQLTSESGEELKGAIIQIPKGQLYNEHVNSEEEPKQLTSNAINITTIPQTVFSADNSNEKIVDISTNVWNTTDVTLSIPGGQDLAFEEYSNTVIWALVSEPLN